MISDGTARWAIALFASAAIGLLVMLTAQQLSHERRVVESSLKSEGRSRVLSFEQHVLRTLTVADVALQDVVEETLQGEDWLYNQADLNDRLITLPIFDAVIVEIPGKPLVSTNPHLRLSKNVLSRFNEIAASARPRPVVTRPFWTSGGRKVGVLRRLDIRSGGYAVILLDPKRFTDFADHIHFGDFDLISLIGLDGVTRARRTGDRFSAGEEVRGLVMERQIAAPNGDYAGPSVLDGIPRFFSHQRLARYDLFATSGIPMAEVTARTRERRDVQLGIMSVAILAILLAAHLIRFALQRSQSRLRDLIQANNRLNEAQRIGSMGDWDYFPAVDRLHWSKNLKRMYHRSDASDVSSIADVAQYVSEEDLGKIKGVVSQILATGETAQWELTATLTDGTETHRRVVAAPIMDDDLKVVGIHGTDQDVTTEVKVRQMEDRISELAKLDTMSVLAATLAHELNQPLAIAANYLAAAAKILPDSGRSAKAESYLKSAQAQIDHLGQIIVGARELAAHSGATIEKIELSLIFRETVQLLRDAVACGPLSARISIAKDAAEVFTNRAHLKQILFNLGRNAVEASCADRPARLCLTSRRLDENTVYIEVQDNGNGFDSKEPDPFAAMTTSKDTGMGLGLSLARTIVEFHGGRIWIERSGPDGATVAFTVRAAPSDEGQLS